MREGKGGKPGKGKDPKGKGKERSPSQTSERGDEKQVCRLHLKGKCPRSAADCKYKHNPVCRCFGKSVCTNGANCNSPHVQGPVSIPVVDDPTQPRPSTPRGKQKAKAKSSPTGSPGGDGGQQRGRSPTPRGGRTRTGTGAAQILFAKMVIPRHPHKACAVC